MNVRNDGVRKVKKEKKRKETSFYGARKYFLQN